MQLFTWEGAIQIARRLATYFGDTVYIYTYKNSCGHEHAFYIQPKRIKGKHERMYVRRDGTFG